MTIKDLLKKKSRLLYCKNFFNKVFYIFKIQSKKVKQHEKTFLLISNKENSKHLRMQNYKFMHVSFPYQQFKATCLNVHRTNHTYTTVNISSKNN